MDERCQPRVQMDLILIAEYAEAMKAGDEFPAVTVFRDGETYWLADGFHRLAAAKEAGKAHVVCDVYPGTIRDAILHAVGANAEHGKRRTNEDKRRAVKTLLNDPEWAEWTDHQIARQCAVSHMTVGRIRSEESSLEQCSNDGETRKSIDRHGNVTERRVENYNPVAAQEARSRVAYILSDDEMSQWSNKAIADKCGVSEGTVWNMRREMSTGIAHIEPLYHGDDSIPPEVVGRTNPANVKTPHVTNNSGENEWYTPPVFIEAAREVMGDIDLDPASSEVADRTVKATTFYSKDDNGLKLPWYGRVWLNPPYAQPLIQFFAEKVVAEYDADNIEQAVVLVNNATETKWFQVMARTATAICFPTGRIKYLDATGTPANTPLQGQAFLYFGADNGRFMSVFEKFGVVR